MSAIFPKPKNREQALVLNLTLALTTPEGHEGLGWLIASAEEYAASLDPAIVETCKAMAVERAKLAGKPRPPAGAIRT
jgi:hypothetical protein